MTSPRQGQGLGALLSTFGKLGLKTSMTLAMNSVTLIDAVARGMAENEGGAWEKLAQGDQAIWRERARAALRALQQAVPT